ncbi:MAG: phosphate signaling complex protein PhoU [Ignavibacteria bacterium]|nr:phosphate signaling complex protein PhoU [Ignavibacteria bacterium]
MKEKLEHMLEDIKKDIIFMANEVEDAMYNALKALEKQDKSLAEKVSKSDKKINYREVEIEKMILSLMALQQPVAVDLRFMVVALKMNNDLERIGDHSKGIAKVAAKLTGEPYIKSFEKIPALGKLTRNMLRDAVQAFININTELALEVRKRDKEVDVLFSEIYNSVLNEMTETKNNIHQGVELISVCRHLERISDLSKNLSEDVVFMKEAKIIRYGIEKNKVS